MKNVFVAVASLSALFALTADAKCYHLSNAPSDTYVCVGKNGSDSFADRKKAQDVCKAATGKDCGSVSSTSSSCHSNSDKCYDESGKASRDLKDY